MHINPLVAAYGLSPDDIDNIIARLPKGFSKPLIVYNDESQLLLCHLQQLRRQGVIELVRLPFQVGKAEAIRRGLVKLFENSDPEIVVQIDGRGKQSPEELSNIVDALIGKGVHMVIGNRYAFQDLAPQNHRRAISNVFSIIIESITGFELPDVACGSRAFRASLAKEFLKLRGFGYGIEVEEILIASSLRLSISEAPIHSKLQADSTNAEKIEDNLLALISYSHDLSIPEAERSTLNYMTTKIKQRKSFDIEMPTFGKQGSARFNYIGGEPPVIGGYTSQVAADAYELMLFS